MIWGIPRMGKGDDLMCLFLVGVRQRNMKESLCGQFSLGKPIDGAIFHHPIITAI